MAKSVSIMLEYTKQRGKVVVDSLDNLAEKHGLSRSCLYKRWKKIGSPAKIGRDRATKLFKKPIDRKKGDVFRLITILPDNVQMTYDQIVALDCCELSKTYVQVKAAQNNFVLHRDDLKAKETRQSSAWRGENDPSTERYLDPDYMPHIKFADLAHLSDDFPNTGAGKGEIPDEEWFEIAARSGRVMSALLSI